MPRINIPIRPVSLNSYYRFTSRGGYITKRGKEFKAEVTEYIKHLKPTDKEIHLKIDFMFRNRPTDIDNPLKAILDVLEGFLYVNDRQITCLSLKRFESDIDAFTIEWEIIN